MDEKEFIEEATKLLEESGVTKEQSVAIANLTVLLEKKKAYEE